MAFHTMRRRSAIGAALSISTLSSSELEPSKPSEPSDPFGPYTTEVEPARLVEVEVPPGWSVRVIEGTEFQVRLSGIDSESDDDGDSDNVSPQQSRGGSGFSG